MRATIQIAGDTLRSLRARRALVYVTLAFAALDLAGTPLAIFAVEGTVRARRDDCRSAEVLRSRARLRITKEQAELPQTLKLLHITDTPAVEAKSLATFTEGLRAVAPVDCDKYSKKSLPWPL